MAKTAFKDRHNAGLTQNREIDAKAVYKALGGKLKYASVIQARRETGVKGQAGKHKPGR
jgi:hypothetical protein